MGSKRKTSQVKKSNNITARDILRLLAIKHADDLFVAECKNGPTQTAHRGELLKLDALVMRKSWVNNCFIGYEIKVSHSDFVHDRKWMGYLSMCNELYFVAPQGVIDKAEVPEQTGLIVTSKNGERLFTTKKAPFRKIDPPMSTLIYILMCRVNIASENLLTRSRGEMNYDFWCDWLDKKKRYTLLGRSVSKELRRIVTEEIDRVKKENQILERKIKEYDEVKKCLEEMGIDHYYVNKYKVINRIEQMKEIIPQDFKRTLGSARDKIVQTLNRLEELENDQNSY